jgi:hypothetical protein
VACKVNSTFFVCYKVYLEGKRKQTRGLSFARQFQNKNVNFLHEVKVD